MAHVQSGWSWSVSRGVIDERWPRILCHSSHWEVESNSPPLETGLVLVNTLTNSIWQKWHSGSLWVQAVGDHQIHILYPRTRSLGALKCSPYKNSDFPRHHPGKVTCKCWERESYLSPAFQSSLPRPQTWKQSSLGPSGPRYVPAECWGLSLPPHGTEELTSPSWFLTHKIVQYNSEAVLWSVGGCLLYNNR